MSDHQIIVEPVPLLVGASYTYDAPERHPFSWFLILKKDGL